MKIFTAAQTREWDAYTIEQEPIASQELMERAGTACFHWLDAHYGNSLPYAVFCGAGNNGGDGLVIAAQLFRAGFTVSVYCLATESNSSDYQYHLQKLTRLQVHPIIIDEGHLPQLPENALVLDALFGSGLARSLEGLPAALVKMINQHQGVVVSIDLPSGLYADLRMAGEVVVKATHTLTFQISKASFFIPSAVAYTGSVHVLDIGLHPMYYQQTNSLFYTIDAGLIKQLYRRRDPGVHKYNLGHALLLAGSNNMMGAAVLCARACLHSGAGLVTVLTAQDTQLVIQIACPEAITTTNRNVEQLLPKKNAIGIGPGMQPDEPNATLLKEVITTFDGNIVVDATALQLLAPLLPLLPRHTNTTLILTPHSGEFDRLFGTAAGNAVRIRNAMEQASLLRCFIVLKGRNTLVACPDGQAYFNTTGNAGMATAGSGDVLTGLLTGLLAQGYPPLEACLLGVYLHGSAGDLAAQQLSQEAMIAGDIIDHIGKAFLAIGETGLQKGTGYRTNGLKT